MRATTPEVSRGGTAIDRVTDLLIRLRWLFVVPIVLPLSNLCGLWLGLRDFVVRSLRRAPERHEARVREIENQIRRWRAAGSNGKLCTVRPGFGRTLTIKPFRSTPRRE